MTNIVEIKKINSNIENSSIYQSDEDAKQIDLNNRLVNLNERVRVATRSIRHLEKERMSFRFKFR